MSDKSESLPIPVPGTEKHSSTKASPPVKPKVSQSHHYLFHWIISA